MIIFAIQSCYNNKYIWISKLTTSYFKVYYSYILQNYCKFVFKYTFRRKQLKINILKLDHILLVIEEYLFAKVKSALIASSKLMSLIIILWKCQVFFRYSSPSGRSKPSGEMMFHLLSYTLLCSWTTSSEIFIFSIAVPVPIGTNI